MTSPTTHYGADFIFPLLRRVPVATFCTHREERIDARYLHFACDPELRNFFALTHRATAKVHQLRADPHATLTYGLLEAALERPNRKPRSSRPGDDVIADGTG